MDTRKSIFEAFGGIRPMARALDKNPSIVMAWKRNGRIPSKHHAKVLETALSLGISVTPILVVYPLGIPADLRLIAEIAGQISPVFCDPPTISQPSNDA